MTLEYICEGDLIKAIGNRWHQAHGQLAVVLRVGTFRYGFWATLYWPHDAYVSYVSGDYLTLEDFAVISRGLP